MGRCDDRIALVTGGASGIGAAAARLLAAEGARVMIADRDAEGGARVAAGIGGRAASVALDVADAASWETAVAATLKAFGGWNVLVNSAGILRHGSVESETLEDWHTTMDINVKGTWRGCRLAVAHMKAGGGSIVNLSSIAGIEAGGDLCAYSVSKGAVRLLTKSVALYCAERGWQVRCNSVHPGIIETPMLHTYFAEREDPQAEREAWDQVMPLGIRGEPEDIGHMIVYLASEESRLVTGTEMVVDGGAMAR